MNIAMFTNTYLPLVGGIENSIATFVEDFKQMGHKCLIVTPEMDGAEESTKEILRVPAVRRFAGSAFSMHLPIPGIIRPRLDEFGPDIIHTHHPFLLGDDALRNARRGGIPLVLTYHTIWDRYADFFPNETIKNIVVNLTLEFSNLCDHGVAPSESIKAFLRSLGIIVPISVIPTGISTEKFQQGDRARGRQMLGIDPDAQVIGYVGRVGPEKNLAYLADAAVLWCLANPRARLLIVGGGDYRLHIKGIFAAAGIEDRIVLAGVRKNGELVDAYAAMDAFAFTSLTDTQGIVLAEAMAGGLPILALDAPGARESVSDRVNGRLLSADSTPQDYAEAVADAFADDARRAQWSENARARSADYSRHRTATQMLELYQGLIDAYEREKEAEGTYTAFDRLAARLEAEWDLLATKAAATVSGVAAKMAREESPEPDPV